MAKHMVRCSTCGATFDRGSVQAVMTGARRYAHLTCDPDNPKLVPLEVKEQNPDLIKLKEYISKTYGDKANWALINRQIKTFTAEKGYSLSGILKSLMYFYEIKGNNISGSNGGIGIIEYCYQDAYNYFYSLFIAQQANKDKVLQTEVKEISIKPPKPKGTKKKFFDLGDGFDEEQ